MLYLERERSHVPGWRLPGMGTQGQNYLPSNPSAEKILPEAWCLQNRTLDVETI